MTAEDEALVNLLLDQRMISKQHAEDIRLWLTRKGKEGEGKAPWLLVEKKLVTEDQVRRLVQGLGKVIPTCYKCLKRSSLPRDAWTGAYICQHCQQGVSIEQHTAGFGEELLPNPPARVVDKIVEKLLVKGGILAEAKLAQVKAARKEKIPRPTLFQLLQQAGSVEEIKLIQLKGKAEAVFRKKLPQTSKLRLDYDLACFLCRLRVVSQKILSEVLQRQLEAALNGQYVALRELLAEQGQLTPHQVNEFLPQQFDRHSRRLQLMAAAQGQLKEEEDGLAEPDWEDSVSELVSELNQTEDDLRVIALESSSADEPAEKPEPVSPREEEQRKLFSQFYEKELKDFDPKKRKGRQ